MTELRDLLDRASTAPADPVPVADDLARARTALRRRRTWRTRTATLGVAALAAAGLGTSALLDGPEREPDRQESTLPGTDGRIRLVAADTQAGPYVIGKIPEDWAVQGENPYRVTIAPTDGSVGDHPDDFVGKLVVLYDQNPIAGEPVEHNGRTFHLLTDGDHTRILVETRAGEPEGVMTVQYPDDTWPLKTMLEFADAVVVTDAAKPGVG